MRILIAALLVLVVGLPAYSQTLPTCGPASTVTPQPWNESRVKWDAVTTYATTPVTAIAVGTVMTYTVYRKVGTAAFLAQCQTTALATALSNQPVGIVAYTVTARTPTSAESVQSASVNKDVTEPGAPSAPGNIVIASTRMEPDSWTCRDTNGAILSRHERQDKAQESCTNFALASLGKAFEMHASAYRIVARRF